jgi:hypothetical protein
MLILFNSNPKKMKNTFSLLFYLKKPRNYVSGEMPIYMRITVDGVPKELSTGKLCDPMQWNTKTCRLDSKKENARIINRYLKTIEDKVDQAHMTGICLHLWSDNGKMKDNDVKFRMVRQMAPSVAYKADTLYYPEPEGMEKKTKQLEAQQLALAKAEESAKQVAQEAEQAKKEAKRLKKNRGKL